MNLLHHWNVQWCSYADHIKDMLKCSMMQISYLGYAEMFNDIQWSCLIYAEMEKWRTVLSLLFSYKIIWFQSICELWIGREIDEPVFSQIEKGEGCLHESESGVDSSLFVCLCSFGGLLSSVLDKESVDLKVLVWCNKSNSEIQPLIAVKRDNFQHLYCI